LNLTHMDRVQAAVPPRTSARRKNTSGYGSGATRGHSVASTYPDGLVADREFGEHTLVTLRRVDLQIGQQTPALGNQDQQTPARRVIFLVCLEMLGQLQDTSTQQRNLHFRRPCVRLMYLVSGDNLPFCFCCQCHLGVATPIFSFSIYLNASLTQSEHK